ncbi:hypothetical protein E4T43_06868 [Aureobasidium subglaciale]|nr:hypothetical protein E4T43_06868 [Aureobasidium subglaciale]
MFSSQLPTSCSAATVAPLFSATPVDAPIHTTSATMLSFDPMEVGLIIAPHGTKHSISDVYAIVNTPPAKRFKPEPVMLKKSDQTASETHERSVMKSWHGLPYSTIEYHAALVMLRAEYAMKSIFFHGNQNSFSFNFALLQGDAGAATTPINHLPSHKTSVYPFQGVNNQSFSTRSRLRIKTKRQATLKIDAINMDFDLSQVPQTPINAPTTSLDNVAQPQQSHDAIQSYMSANLIDSSATNVISTIMQLAPFITTDQDSSMEDIALETSSLPVPDHSVAIELMSDVGTKVTHHINTAAPDASLCSSIVNTPTTPVTPDPWSTASTPTSSINNSTWSERSTISSTSTTPTCSPTLKPCSPILIDSKESSSPPPGLGTSFLTPFKGENFEFFTHSLKHSLAQAAKQRRSSKHAAKHNDREVTKHKGVPKSGPRVKNVRSSQPSSPAPPRCPFVEEKEEEDKQAFKVDNTTPLALCALPQAVDALVDQAMAEAFSPATPSPANLPIPDSEVWPRFTMSSTKGDFNHSAIPAYLVERTDGIGNIVNVSGDRYGDDSALIGLKKAMKFWNKARRGTDKIRRLDPVTLKIINASGISKSRNNQKAVNDFHDDMVSLIKFDKHQNKDDDFSKIFKKVVADDPIAEGEEFVAFAGEEGLVTFEAEDEQRDTEVDDGDDEAETSAEDANVTPDGMEETEALAHVDGDLLFVVDTAPTLATAQQFAKVPISSIIESRTDEIPTQEPPMQDTSKTLDDDVLSFNFDLYEGFDVAASVQLRAERLAAKKVTLPANVAALFSASAEPASKSLNRIPSVPEPSVDDLPDFEE